MRHLILTLTCVLCLPMQARAWDLSAVQDAEVLVDLPPLSSEENEALPPLARHRIAATLGREATAQAALEDERIPGAIRHWLKARRASETGDHDAALAELELAREIWVRGFGEEPQRVLQHLDRDRLTITLRADDLDAAEEVVRTALTSHARDGRWAALQGVLMARRGDGAQSRRRLDEAWDSAKRRERGHWSFAWRAAAKLESGDQAAAAEAWFAFTDRTGQPGEIRDAIAFWDARPELAVLLHQDGFRMKSIRWLSRILRREDALAVALEGWKNAPEHEAARCYAAAAEQLYRLRRHEDLLAHLAEPRPSALNAEERASLAAYPWGVERRGGSSIEVATGFDDVVRRHQGTNRAVEALWESAWMWELSGEADIAHDRFATYATEHAKSPFGQAAAGRAVFLPLWMNQPEVSIDTYATVRSSLGDAMDQAVGLWALARSLEAIGQAERAESARSTLADEHPGNPLLYPPPFPLTPDSQGEDWSDVLTALADRQRDALERIAGELEIDPFVGPDPRWRAAARLLELGLFAEGEALLAELTASARRDPATQFRAVALAWRYGRSERQARDGYQLRLLLRGRDEALDLALDALAHPTPFARDVLRASREQGVPAGLLWSTMRRESFYEADVVSLAGAYGLMQLLPTTAERMATRLGDPAPALADLRQPLTNLRYGSTYLRGLIDESEGDVYRALASYNAGENNGLRWSQRRREGAPPQEMIPLISYSETRRYVYHVLRYWRVYSAAYPELGRRDGLLP